MAKVLTSEQKANVRMAIFKKADAFGYSSSGRIDSGRFMDELVEDLEIGGVLKQYMSTERVRTYIKDSELNAYAKKIVNDALESVDPAAIIKKLYGVESEVIQNCTGKDARVSVLRSEDGLIFVVSGGTVLKWETALRKALEIIAKQPGLTIMGTTPAMCLPLVSASDSLTVADKQHITTALGAVGVKATFVDT